MRPHVLIGTACYSEGIYNTSACARSVKTLRQAKGLPFDFTVNESPARFGSRPLTHKRNFLINGHVSQKIKQKLPTGFTHWFLVDHDHEWTWKTIQKLIEDDKDIISAAYLSKSDPRNLEAWEQDKEGANTRILPATTKGILKLKGGCGAGALLCKREALERMEYPWFSEYTWIKGDTAEVFSEDGYFAKNARKNNVEFWLDADCRAKHFKTIIKGADVMEKEVQQTQQRTVLDAIAQIDSGVNKLTVQKNGLVEQMYQVIDQQNQKIKDLEATIEELKAKKKAK